MSEIPFTYSRGGTPPEENVMQPPLQRSQPGSRPPSFLRSREPTDDSAAEAEAPEVHVPVHTGVGVGRPRPPSTHDAFSKLSGSVVDGSSMTEKSTQTERRGREDRLATACQECGGGDSFVCVGCARGLQTQIREMASAHEELLEMHRRMSSLTERLIRQQQQSPSSSSPHPAMATHAPSMMTSPTSGLTQTALEQPTSVPAWLYSIGLGHLSAVFVEHEVDVSILRDLTERDLIAMGVGDEASRMRLLLGIAKLKHP